MKTEPRDKYRFPWHDGNQFRLLVDGHRFFPVMLNAIEHARAYILLEMYLIESGVVADRFIAALADAAGRGVRVYLLLDDFGAWKLQAKDRTRLAEAGVQVAYYNPLHYGKLRRNLFRNHRKLLLVDGAIAFTGGLGITDAFDPPQDPGSAWHDTAIEMQGPVVADWQALFAETWKRWSDQPLVLPQARRPRAAGAQRGRVVTVHAPGRVEIRRSLVRAVRSAEYRVWVAIAYFVPSWKLRRAVRQAARRGVDVRLLLPGPITDHPAVRHAGRRFYSRLLRNGVRIFEYQPRFIHTKVILCDDWVSTGSSNADRWNLHWNLEANQEVDDPGFAAEAQAMFETDFTDALEIRYEEWRRRPWHRRLLEWFWGTVDIWLERGTHVWRPRAKRHAKPQSKL